MVGTFFLQEPFPETNIVVDDMGAIYHLGSGFRFHISTGALCRLMSNKAINVAGSKHRIVGFSCLFPVCMLLFVSGNVISISRTLSWIFPEEVVLVNWKLVPRWTLFWANGAWRMIHHDSFCLWL